MDYGIAGQERDQNSYDFVRCCAASAVLFSHHFDLNGFAEPRVPFYGEDFGQLAVAVFFSLSGFLIAQSLNKKDDAARFFAARILRIFPNLICVLVVTSLATIVAYGNYSHIWQHLAYVARNLTMFLGGVSFIVPGVLADATRQSLNDPLWTLPHELWLYVSLFVICGAVARARSAAILGTAIGLSVFRMTDMDGVLIGPLEAGDIVNLGSYFFAGAAVSVFWSGFARFHLVIGCAGLAALIAIGSDFTALKPLTLAACILGLGSSQAMAWFARGGDASYGMYLFGWPVQQLCIHWIGSFWCSLALAFLATAAVGYATWHGFERRALSYRDSVAQLLRSSSPINWLRLRKRVSGETV